MTVKTQIHLKTQTLLQNYFPQLLMYLKKKANAAVNTCKLYHLITQLSLKVYIYSLHVDI